jgi:glycine betaine/proline transport system permease protein
MITGLDRRLLAWIAVIFVTLITLALRNNAEWLVEYPTELVLPLTPMLNSAMEWFVATFGFVFQGISWLLEFPVRWAREFLHWLPWTATIALVTIVAHAAGGWRLAMFALLSMTYMLVTGFWAPSMNSLALVAISVPLAIAVGFAVGVLAFLSPRLERIVIPTLDLLQTVPAFAYLIPILLLFGFGPVVGLIASLLYSFPPMVRNTILGLKTVPVEIVESGLMSGATPGQLFWHVRVPSAAHQMLLGINQTTMASLSMVIVASIIGGTDDIGWAVLSTMRKALFGESLLAGIVIALIAMIMDRVTWGFSAHRGGNFRNSDLPWHRRYRYWLLAAAAVLVFSLATQLFPAIREYPREWVISPAAYLDQAIEYIVVNYRTAIETIKTIAFFFVMLPVRIGLAQTVTPMTWGFELTDALVAGYAALSLGVVGFAWRYGGWAIAVSAAILGIVLYFGLTNLPWPALLAMFTTLGFVVGGWRLGLGTLGGLLFILLAGIWPEAVQSLYICGLAVAISFAVGALIGVWAAANDHLSAIIRPINDTLQTMPLFVLLIPIVMIFKIGEFTALLSIIAYATVPAIRYTEHGLRNVSKDVVEAATSMGCTERQLLWHVKLPLALPVIMLGLNQTIMFGIAMLVIAALVGTNELGQRVYIGLGDGDFGVGMVAGLGMAIIAMISDRMTQAWSKRRQEALGLSTA